MDNLVISNYYEWSKIERKDKKSINYFIDKIAIPKPQFRDKYNFFVIKPNKAEAPILSPHIVEVLKDPNLKAKIFDNGIIVLSTKTKVLFSIDMNKALILNLDTKFSSESVSVSEITQNEIIIETDSGKIEKIGYALELDLCNPGLPFNLIQTRFAFN